MISIVVPVYMAENSIRQCVNSVLGQTLSDFELILVDDGSPDNCGTICDEYAQIDRRITVIHKVNEGVSSARNAGIRVAKGEFLAFCDSDDYMEPDFLAVLLETAQNNPECGHIWCLYNKVKAFHEKEMLPSANENKLEFFTLDSYMQLHGKVLNAQPWNKLYRTSIIKTGNVSFPEDLSLGEDLLFNLAYIDASRNNRIVVVNRPLYNYVCSNENSLNNKYRANLKEIYDHLFEVLRTHLIRWHVFQNSEDSFYNCFFYAYLNVLNNNMLAPVSEKKAGIKRNNDFLKSNSFQRVLDHRTCYVHPLYLYAYRGGRYELVLLLNRLYELKKNFLLDKNRR